MGELLLGTMGSLSELLSEGKSGSFFYYRRCAYSLTHCGRTYCGSFFYSTAATTRCT